MEKHSEEKSLIVFKETSIFSRIKKFLIRFFRGKEITENEPQIDTIDNNEMKTNINQKTAFIDSIRNIENDETKLLQLQKQFDRGEIDRSDLTEEQVANLTALYKKQINDLEPSNERRINKIRQRKDGESFLKSVMNIENKETKLLKLQKQYDDGLIKTKDLPKDQINALINLYKKQINELSRSNERRKEKLLIYRNKIQNA